MRGASAAEDSATQRMQKITSAAEDF